jgi:hypothetical protein
MIFKESVSVKKHHRGRMPHRFCRTSKFAGCRGIIVSVLCLVAMISCSSDNHGQSRAKSIAGSSTGPVSGLMDSIRQLLVLNTATIIIETLPLMEDTTSRRYKVERSRSPDSIDVIVNYISTIPDSQSAGRYAEMLQPALCRGAVRFLSKKGNLFVDTFYYEILEGGLKIGTVEFLVNGQTRFYRLTQEGYDYFLRK